MTEIKPKIKFNPSILIHNVPRKLSDIKSGPMTIADLSAELANIDKGIEFIATTGEKDNLLDAFLSEKESSNQNNNQ